MLSVSEALMGQLYLVSAVALLVSNLGAQRTRRRVLEPEPSPVDPAPGQNPPPPGSEEHDPAVG